MYEQGRGVKKNFKTAVKWYRQAAEKGLPLAQNMLANLYRRGKGVRRNDKEALKWYRKAATQFEGLPGGIEVVSGFRR